MAWPILRRLKRVLLREDAIRWLNRAYPQHDIGAHSYGGLEIIGFGDDTRISIGKYCSFAANVAVLLGGEHRPDWVSTYPFSDFDPGFSSIEGHPASKGHITIGHDVWVGREAMILSGVTIGNGAVIAARSVVTKDVAPYSIVAGQPAQHMRYRFDDDVIQRLQAIGWWDWSDESVRKAVPLLLQGNIGKFLDAAETGDF